jgi:Tfp pilus assembly protein FimT
MELILVLGILVILTAVTLPGILRWQRAMPMEQAVSMLQLQLQETRGAAIHSGEAWSLILPNAGTPGRRQPLRTSQAGNQEYLFRLPAGIRCEIIEPVDTAHQRAKSTAQIVFQPDGTVRDCSLRITTDTGLVTILQIHRMTGMATITQVRVRTAKPGSYGLCKSGVIS